MDEDELGEGKEERDEVWSSGDTSPPGLHDIGKHSPKERDIATRRFASMGRVGEKYKKQNNLIGCTVWSFNLRNGFL